ncbi:MAG: exodeoxyribonuclease VII small subunit [Dehalococcoidia bacterium]
MAEAQKQLGSSFEDLLGQLQQATERLEAGKLGLEESVALYEESANLVERLRSLLDEAEERVQNVQKRFEGR